MVSFRSILALAPLAALALAQSKVAFTSLPASLNAGESFNISWAGGDGTAVTLTLRRGNPNDLDTVSTIASGLTEYWYNWDVPRTLEAGDDYALQITQGQSDINYSGLFSIENASASNSTSSSSSSAIATRSGNSTMSITSMASASGTGTAMNRNTTFSTASLTSSDGGAYTFGESSTSNTRSSTRAAATSAATSAPSNDAPAMVGSSAALIMGLVAAMMLH